MRPCRLKKPVALLEGRSGGLVVSGDRLSGRLDGRVGKAGFGQRGRRTHPLRQHLGKQRGQAEGLEVVRQRPARERLRDRIIARQCRRSGSDDIRPARDAANPARSGRADHVGLGGKTVVPGGGHDAQTGMIRRRQIDARPTGNVAGGGDQPGVPGRRPG